MLHLRNEQLTGVKSGLRRLLYDISMTTTTLPAHALMLSSLDLLAAQDIDLVPRFFARFYASHPQDQAMFHNPASSHGAMVNEIMDTLLALARGEDWVELMLRNQVRTHHDHGDIALERYAQTLDLFLAVLADAGGAQWQADWEQAWRDQADRMMAIITRWY